MKKLLRNLTVALSLISIICASGCTGRHSQEATAVPESDISVTEEAENPAVRTVEVDRGDNFTCVFEFDKNGLLIKEINISARYKEGTPINQDDPYVITYDYDEDGKLISKTSNNIYGTVDAKKGVTEYIYNENGQIAQIKRPCTMDYVKNDYDTFIYNEDGKLAGKYSFFNNRITGYTEYEYGENGNCTQEFNVFPGERIMDTTHYEYDENGVILSSVTRNSNWEETGSETYENGLLTDMYYTSSCCNEIRSYTYEYDSEGKMTKRTHLDSEEVDEEGLLTGKKVPLSTFFTYDENGVLISTESENNPYPTTYEYFDNGNIIRTTYYYDDGSIQDIEVTVVPEVKGNYSEIYIEN